MGTPSTYPHEYRIPVTQEFVRSVKSPHSHLEHLSIIHALIQVRDFPNANIPDKVNPRCHEKIKMASRVPEAIEDTMRDDPELFHLLNRGCLILAKKAWYDNQTRTLHFIIESEDEHGMVDGATTDRVLARLKQQVSNADFSKLNDEEIPESFKEAYIHVEIIAGDIDADLRLKLADARNTSEQVKEFSLLDLGDKFNWLKDVLENSELKGRIRYRENEQKPVDVRTVLALLTLFHPAWLKDSDKEPIVAYTGKGAVLDLYEKQDWAVGYEKLAPVVVDILKLYDHVHIKFQERYMAYVGTHAKLGRRREVRYIEDPKKAKELPITRWKTQYVLPDGWLYPLLAAFRVLLDWPKAGRGEVKWITDPFRYFDKYGAELVADVIDQSEELAHNPNAAGKSRRLWRGLRMSIENKLLKSAQGQLISA